MFSALIPSMFHRRLALMGGMVLLGMAAPAVQMARLTVVKGDELLADAEKKLVSERWIETRRGRIIDRKGRTLAIDRPSYDVAVDYRVITGEWAFTQATRRARGIHRDVWYSISPAEREALIARYLPDFRSRLEAMWTQFAALGGVSMDELEARKSGVKLEIESLRETVRNRQIVRRESELERGREIAGETAPLPPGLAAGAEPKAAPEAAAPAGAANKGGRRLRVQLVEDTRPHVLLRGVDDKTAFAFMRSVEPESGGDADLKKANAAAVMSGQYMPGLRVVDSQRREYPLDSMDVEVDRTTFPGPLKSDSPARVRVEGVATHVVGWMRRRVWSGDNEGRRARLGLDAGAVDRGRYQAGDQIGDGGIEGSAEDELRGLRGREATRLDTGDVERSPEQPGGDVRLTIDAALQARVQALFDPALGLAVVQGWHKNPALDPGKRLNGAVVVIEIETGDVVALVSAPTFTHATLENTPGAVFGDEANTPYLDRAVARPYQPGSIVKPIVLCGATTSGVYAPAERVACTGHFYPNSPNVLRCWIYKQSNNTRTHSGVLGHDLDGSDALMASCNIFFFEMGSRLGPKALPEWFSRFGVGRAYPHPSLGVGPQWPGEVRGAPGERPAEKSDAVFMAIGQGPITWTPLHAADAYATIARGGLRLTPSVRADTPAQPRDLHLDPRAVEQTLRGLRRGVEEDGGTTNHIYPFGSVEVPQSGPREAVFTAAKALEGGAGLTVWAKSGTADAGIVGTDSNADGTPEFIRPDHSWVTCLVGTGDTPRYAISVVVENGGSGGRVAGPIANQVIRALTAEGYLPTPRPGAEGNGSERQ